VPPGVNLLAWQCSPLHVSLMHVCLKHLQMGIDVLSPSQRDIIHQILINFRIGRYLHTESRTLDHNSNKLQYLKLRIWLVTALTFESAPPGSS
jgi:hypothetical protein